MGDDTAHAQTKARQGATCFSLPFAISKAPPVARRRERSVERDGQGLAALWRIDDLHLYGLAFGK
ncbi:MAG: hypothetical protein ACT4O2_03135, partial [Beijerinckiaceae bacterium]